MRNILGYVAGSLAVIGALNWGLVGLFNFDLVHSVFGPSRTIQRSVYTLVGLGGLLLGTFLALGWTSGFGRSEDPLFSSRL